jgi:Flp pilus assembly pilin Flp
MFSSIAKNQTLNGRTASFARDERGLTTVEYIIILVLIAVGGIGAWNSFGKKLTTKVGEQGDTIQKTTFTP